MDYLGPWGSSGKHSQLTDASIFSTTPTDQYSVLTEWCRCLCSSLILMAVVLSLVAGHFGGSLTHGKGYLTGDVPGWLGRDSTTGLSETLNTAGFASIQPVLSEHCGACHGPEKSKGGLRTDSLESLLTGGHSGPAILPGDAGRSSLIKRMMLALADDDHMPPEGKPQPTPGQVRQIRDWILAGALE